ncbi:MAG TPA: site-2 protease family protein [bacterium (Candidatus Stahlbacteria)]|nr:site-2 protease family protein [Candidatus Stahlbacteria bacterium]
MEELIEKIGYWMVVDEVVPGITIASIKGTITEPKERAIEKIKEVVSASTPYFPLFSREDDRDVIDLVVLKKKGDKKRNPVFNLALFLATIFTTLFIGSLNQGGNPVANPADLWLGIPFSFSLMAILTGHELGHYLTSRHFKVQASLPYFLPIPHPLIGTLGAVIKMDSVIPNRKALFWIGLTGPLTGFIISIPIIYFGLSLSRIESLQNYPNAWALGDSLLFFIIGKLTHPSIPPNMDIILHPMAFAGWVGLLVTGLNLVPLGQLDGGHISYSLMLKKRRYISLAVIIALGFLGLYWYGWFLWIIIGIFLSMREPMIQDRITRLDSSYYLLSLIPITILILSFIPIPFFISR